MLIAFLENNLNADGSVNIPEALRPYMGGMEKLPQHNQHILTYMPAFLAKNDGVLGDSVLPHSRIYAIY